MNNLNLFQGLAAICLGFLAVFYRNAIAKYIIRNQNASLKIKFGENSIKATAILIMLFGAILLIFGVLLLTGIIKI
jgi:hypothetical protein